MMRKRIWQLIKVIFAFLILFYLVHYIRTNISAIDDFKFHFNYCYLAISFIILFVYLIDQFFIWHYITARNNCHLPFSKSIVLRAYSEFGKYIPGKIVGYTILYHEYSKSEKSVVQLTYSMILELIASSLASALLFLFSLFITDIPEFSTFRLGALVFIVFFLIIIHPRILNIFSSLLFRMIRKEPIMLKVSYFELLKIIFMYVLNFMVFGVAFILFIKSFYNISFTNYLFITGTTAAAGLIGFFAVFVPAGLGVREGVLIFTLSFIIPPTVAGIIALTSRVWLTAGEIFLFFSILATNKIKIFIKDFS